ncbi:MAG: glycerophosphodiester phosphodiesterase [Actinomycetota bacterium]|nr:glycerophosphodiester phosphodiesterase [Actinomycetota bacterium]
MHHLTSLIRPPIAFAHRGASAHAPENTLDAFRLGLEMGATGLESDVWLSADGVPVLDHEGALRSGLRRRPFSELARRDLPSRVLALEDLYAAVGSDFHLSLDLKDPAAAERVVAVAGGAGDALGRLWLCHGDWRRLAGWRGLSPEVHLVDSTRLRRVKEGPERRAAALSAAGIDAVNLHHTEWSGGLTTLFHRFGLFAFGWDCQHERVLEAVVAMGIDGVYSDHVDRMAAVMRHAFGPAFGPASGSEEPDGAHRPDPDEGTADDL